MTISNPQCSFGAKPRYPTPAPPSTRLCWSFTCFFCPSLHITHTNAHCLTGLSHHPSNPEESVVLTCPCPFFPNLRPSFGYSGFLLLTLDSAAAPTFPVFRTFQERRQINESEAVNFNEANQVYSVIRDE